MLHMVVVTHGPDTCPIGNPEAMVKVMAAIGRMGALASWASPCRVLDQYARSRTLVRP